LVKLIQMTRLDVDQLERQLRQSMRPDAEWREFVVLPQSPTAKQVWRFAESEQARFGHSKIGMEHLLLALVATPDEPVAELLASTGLTVDLLRRLISQCFPPELHESDEDRAKRQQDEVRERQHQMEEENRQQVLAQQIRNWEESRAIRAFVT